MSRRARLRQRLRKEDLEQLPDVEQLEQLEQEAEPDKTVATAKPEDRVLELQKTAGNRAVGAALGRAPVADAAPLPTSRWPKEPEARFDDFLIVPIDSAQEAQGRRPPQGREDPERTDGDMVIHTKVGDHTAKLHRALLQGRRFAKVEIVLPNPGGGVRIVLVDVVLVSVQISGDGAAITLNFRNREYTHTPPGPQP